MPAKPNLKKVSTTNLRRVGTRKRVAKVLDDYVDATFSESEPPNLHKIPVPPNQNIRPPKASRTSANADNTFQDCSIGAESSHDNNDGPIFRTQQTSQGTEQWSFRDHNTLSEDESLASQDSEGSNEDTAASTNFEAERELQGLTSQSPDNQLGYTELHSLEVENCGYESDSQEQVILPGTSGIVNSHPQLKQNYVHENEAQNHSVIRPYSSRNENPRPKLNQNDGRGMKQQQQVTRPGLSSNENHRPQLNRNYGHGCEPQQQLVIRPGPSRNVNCQRENTRNVIEPQQHVMPGPSRKVNSHPQHENSRHGSNQQQHVIRPGPSREMNSNLSLNAQHHQIIRPGPSRNENLRPKVNSNVGQGSMPSQQPYALTTPSSRVNSRQQSSQSLPEMPNAVFQDYTKRSLEFLKIQFREMTAKIDDLLDSRPKPCICTIQRIEENEQQFLLHLDSFDAIEHLENSMKDQQSRQQMILLLLRIGGINLQKTVYAIMEKLFSYEIGTKFTWTGKSSKGIEKAKFSDLKNIYAAISGAVLGNKDLAGDEKTTVKVQYQVTEWLRHCQQNLKSQM